MSQSIAHLIKNKIFQGNTSSSEHVGIEDRRKKGRKWGRRRNSDGGNTSVWTGDGIGIQFPRSPVSPRREEGGISRNRIEDRIDEEESGSDTAEADQTEGDGENGEEELAKRGKLGMLKSKISIGEFSFKTPHLGHHQHSSFSDRQRNFDVSPKSAGMSPGGFAARRPSHERNPSAIGSLRRFRSNSSASSLRFFSSPRRSGGSNTCNGDPGNRPQQLSHSHGRNNSAEMRSAKAQPVSYNRRRSKTLDTYGDHKVKRDNTGDLLSTINAHLSNCRNSSVRSRSPSLKTQEVPAAAAGAVSPPTPPSRRCSNAGTVSGSVKSGSYNSNTSGVSGSIPFPSGPSEPQQAPALSRCGSSIANALNSFVNLRSFSISSSYKYQMSSRVGLALPPPPAPDENESPEDYLLRISPYGSEIGTILTETDDSFKKGCLHHFLLHHFDFTNCPLDVAMRILLIFLKLPRESQQIDRLLLEFSKVYYKTQCDNEPRNDIFWIDENQLYFLSFSLLMLHTDCFSPKNRFKMSKKEFVDLVHGDTESYGYKVPKEILSYFYDNITAKEFPKIDWACNIAPQNSESESDTDSSKIYSPLEVLKTRSFSSNSDFTPLPAAQMGRTSSNSFSSYLAHGPVSSSSSSLTQDDVDIYGHIFDSALSVLSLKPLVQKVWDGEYVFELFNNRNKYNKYFAIFKEAKGGYLRLLKNDLKRLSFPRYDILNPLDPDLNFMYLKIIQMGEIEELTVNRKFSIVGSANKTMWKRQLGILTSCGLLTFDDSSWIEPHLIRDECTGTSNYVIDYQPSPSMVLDPVVPVKGLLAVNKSYKLLRQALWKLDAIEDETEARSGNTGHMAESHFNSDIDDNCIMRLYGSHSGKIWKCYNSYERDNWIDAINLMASCDGCFIDVNTIPNTIVSARKYDVKERIDKLRSTAGEKLQHLNKLENLLALYGQTMPICTRTKNELLFHIKQLAVTMEWLVYEVKRNEIDSKILEQLSSQFDITLDGRKVSSGTAKLIDDCHYNAVRQQRKFAHKPCLSVHTSKPVEVTEGNITKQRERRSYSISVPTSDSLSSSSTSQPTFEEELMQSEFQGDHDTVNKRESIVARC